MRRRAILSLAASCTLAACAHPATDTAPGMAWSLVNSADEGAKLAYGQPQSDNVLLMLSCAPGGGQITVSLSAGDAAPAVIDLAAGDRTARYEGETSPSFGEGGSLIEAQASAADPTLMRFANGESLTVLENGRRSVLPVRADERDQVRSFFKSCRAA